MARDDNDSDDLDWMAAIGGRPRPGTDPRTLLEATLLRAAARAWAPRPLPAETLAEGAEPLVARARREGLLAARPRWCAGCAERWRRWRERPWAGAGLGLALAAVFAVLVFGILPPRDDGRDAVVQRSSPTDGVWLLRSDSPQAQRDRIADDLAAAGLVVRRYERLGRYGLDAELPAAQAKAVGPALRRHGVQAEVDGVLRIEVEKAGP